MFSLYYNAHIHALACAIVASYYDTVVSHRTGVNKKKKMKFNGYEKTNQDIHLCSAPCNKSLCMPLDARHELNVALGPWSLHDEAARATKVLLVFLSSTGLDGVL